MSRNASAGNVMAGAGGGTSSAADWSEHVDPVSRAKYVPCVVCVCVHRSLSLSLCFPHI